MKRSVRTVLLLLGLLLGGLSPVAWAELCSAIFFPGPSQDGLNGNVTWGDFPVFDASGRPVLTAINRTGENQINTGNSYWRGGTSSPNWRLTTSGIGTARVYVDGNLSIGNNAEVNRYGNPSNLIILVKGDLVIGDSSNIYINALIYVTGTATIGNNARIRGAISSAGSMSKGNNIVYDTSAIPGTDFGSLCENPDSKDQVHHYRFVHAASGLSCNPLDVTLQVCATADCSRLYEGSISATLNPSTWEGGNLRNFSGGQALLKLRGVGEVTLGIATVTPAATNPLRCSTADCKVSFAESGFIFTVPDLLAGKPQDGIAVQAVRTAPGDPQRCVPGFGPATRTLQFWGTHVAPGTGSMALMFNGGAISMNAAAPTSLTLDFDNTATAVLPSLSYADAGNMRLNARYLGTGVESGLDMRGSDEFVSRPYGFHIAIKDQSSSCTAAALGGCEALQVNGARLMAGDPFDLNIRAVAWQSDGELRTEGALRDNPTTPNFQLSGMRLDSLQALPAAGEFEYLNPAGAWAPLTSYDHSAGSMTLRVRQREVGIFQLGAAPPAYFGQSIGGGESGLLGRFTPAWLDVSSDASLEHACGSFSYQGQVIGFVGGHPAIRITGYNRQGVPTNNYDRGDFWRLASAPQRQDYALAVPGELNLPDRTGLAARLRSLGAPQSLPADSETAGNGSRTFEWREDGARQADALLWDMPAVPGATDLPLDLNAGGGLLQLRVAQAQLTDLDGICYRGSVPATGACQDFVHAIGGTELRLGRLRIENARGPEEEDLDLPYWLESWRNPGSGPDWLKESDDVCSLPALQGDVRLSGFSGVPLLSEDDFPPAERTLAPPAGMPLPSGLIRLPAPNKQGSVLVSLAGLNGVFPGWLLHDWNGDGQLEPASGRATFGPQSTQRALIFRRELYR